MSRLSWIDDEFGPAEVQNDGVVMATRPSLNFIGFDVTDNPTDNRTDVSAESGSSATQVIAAYEIDWTLGSVFSKTLGAGAQVFTFAGAADAQTIVVVVTGAASTLTWPTVQWAGGVAPTQTTSGTDVYTFVKAGSTIYGSVVQDMS